MTAKEPSGTDRESEKIERALGFAAVVLFVLFMGTTTVRIIAGWRQGWWDSAWEAMGGLFSITILAYLSAGGASKVLGKGRPGYAHRLTIVEKVGRLGVALLFLALVGNFIAATWTPPPFVFDIARNVVGAGFMACFVSYIVLRYRQYRSSRE